MVKMWVVRTDKSLALFQPCDSIILCCHNFPYILSMALTSFRLKICLATKVGPDNI